MGNGESAFAKASADAKATADKSADKAADKRGTGEWGMNDHPLREENYVKVIGSPEFPKGAKLEVCLDRINKIDRIKRAAPEQENPVNPVNPVKKESALRIKIPKADGNPDSRVAVRPCSSLGTKGKVLGATWRG